MILPHFAEIASGIGGTGVGGLIIGAFGHRKAKADAAAVLTATAMSLVEPLKEEIGDLTKQLGTVRGELGTVRAELSAHKGATERREAARQQALSAHTEWDTQMADRLRAAGVDVPEPPPLDVAS
ncbi:hypothetical protein [Nocardia sp. NPDC046763]|uniref:hypothetical protein n=1 Tax=Nocardia sp. NPDC046763 TaxID=3155256 RepID=UPI00340AAF0E